MSNQLPAALASRQRRSVMDDAVAGLGVSRGAHISIRGNRFRLINAAGAEFLVPTASLDVVVVDANRVTSKLFFEGEYDPNNDAPPTCFSDNGTGPSSLAMSPQAPTCAVCPWNVMGSDQSKVTGRGIKACSDRKKLAVIVPDDTEMNVYELQIPPGSLTNLKAYSKWLAEQVTGGRKLDIADVVTRMEFDPDKMGTLMFSAAAYADDDRTLQIIDYIDANQLADAAVGRTDVAANPEVIKQLMSAGGGATAALPAPAAPAQGQQFVLPPREAAPLPAPVAPTQPQAPAAPQQATPRRRNTRTAAPEAAAPAAAAPSNVAPFVAPAAPRAAAPAMPAAEMPDIPQFLQRAPGGAPAAAPAAPAAAPAPRFGVGAPPAPPPAVAAAMGLPTRR